MDTFGNGRMNMRHTIEEILKRGNYIRMMDGRYTDGFVNLEVLQIIINEGGAEVFENQGVKMARKLTKRSPDARKSAIKKVSSNKKGFAKPARG